MKILKRTTALVLVSAVVWGGAALSAERYDVVFKGGLVMDPESGLEAVRNVGVRGGKIAAITPERLAGEQVIDVSGRIVAPGFVDLHSHAHSSLVGGRVQAFDGVTTALEAEVGQLPVDMAYEKAAAVGRAINYGYTASWAIARMAVMAQVEPDGTPEGLQKIVSVPGWATRTATEQQAAEIRMRLERGLDEGAIGIGVLLGYAPAATVQEIYELSQLAARRDATIFVHMRSTVSNEAAIQEVMANAVTTGAHWHICHAPLERRAQLNDQMQALEKAGARVTTETMTVFGGSTFISAEFLRPEAMKRAGYEPQSIIYYGRRVASFEELARLQKEDPAAFVFTVMDATDETDLKMRGALAASLSLPGWGIVSDAMPWTDFSGKLLPQTGWPLPQEAWAHPRSAGNYSRAIQKYVREWKLVSLMDVLRAGSLNTARVLEQSVPQMRHKGRLKVGADADIIVFDLQKVGIAATQEKPGVLSTGMEHVMVNGQLLIHEGRLNTHARPGRPIRRETRPRTTDGNRATG